MPKSEKATVVAYITYMVEQNAPSRPEILRARVNHLKEDLEKLAAELLDPLDMELITMKEERWGDVRVYPKGDDEVAVFVTFEDKKILKKFLSSL